MDLDSKPKTQKPALKHSKLRKRMQPQSNLCTPRTEGMVVDNSKNPAMPAALDSSQLRQRTLQLRDQLNFYFGDSNLAKDKFLQTQLKQSPLIPLDLFVKFNRIKELLEGMNATQQVSSMQQAVSRSNMLKLSKCRTKLKRRIPFNPANIDFQKMDAATIYVESFPKEVTVENMASIFQRAGQLRFIKLPRYPDGQVKGFCFIEYASHEEAQLACSLFNNCVPQEFVNSASANYVTRRDSLVTPLRVMLKSEWQTYKVTVRKIQKEVDKLAFGQKQQTGSLQEFLPGTIVEIAGLKDLSKIQVTERVSHYMTPAYVQMSGDKAVVRFNCKEDAETFVQRQKMGKVKVLTDKEVKENWQKAAQQQGEYKAAMAGKRKRQAKGEAKGV